MKEINHGDPLIGSLVGGAKSLTPYPVPKELWKRLIKVASGLSALSER